MKEEYNALIKNKTWKLVPIPKDKNIIGCKWIYKLKNNAGGTIHKYKSRLVAKGYINDIGLILLKLSHQLSSQQQLELY